jgi:hypothetical protein
MRIAASTSPPVLGRMVVSPCIIEETMDLRAEVDKDRAKSLLCMGF